MSKRIEIQFEKQEHQQRAVDSTTELFSGYTKRETQFQLGDETIPNMDQYEMLDEEWLFDNLLAVQRKNNLIQDMFLNFEDGFELTGIDSWRYPYYTCEMETGTGKTFVYLQTIHELRKIYGWGKYIIIVPSVAIYEGVVKTFEITKKYFAKEYDNATIHLTSYSGSKISKLRGFANSSDVEVMVMTIDSFNSATNVIYKPTEKLQGEKLPYQYIQETRPILILDESQNYNSENARSALRTLHPLFAIKYSATPQEKGKTKEETRELMNRFYHLSPVDAFQQNLVKKIEVLGVTEKNNFNAAQLSLTFNESRAGYDLTVEGKLNVLKDGELKPTAFTLKKGDDLFAKTKNENYKGYTIQEINRADGMILFENGLEYRVAEGGDVTLAKEEIFRIQIEETIKAHMIKQRQMIEKGVKVLSLFFIDKVANYVENDGIIKKLFDKAFDNLKKQFPYFASMKPEEVREGYFAKKTTKGKLDEFVDTSIEKKTQAERELEQAAYNLIMKEKEKLLNFDEKKCFIFAHSALKEGWDNPNVFQICTLNTATSEKRKRQEIGRGLRLAVNQEGDRMKDEGVNVLTVIANESYEDYCEQLQSDYRESGDTPPPRPSNSARKEAVRNNDLFNSKAFKDFWKKLCLESKYTIHVDEEKLKEDCITKLNVIEFPEPKIVLVRGKFVMTTFEITLESISGEIIKLKIRKTDTDGNEDIFNRNFKKGDDLAKIAKDERFKGYQIVDFKEAGDFSEITFGDKGILRLNETVSFTSEKGQKGNPIDREEKQTNYPVFNIIKRAEEATNLKRTTIVEIFKGMKDEKKQLVFRNPEGFSAKFIETIKNTLADHIAEKVEYSLTSEMMKYTDDDIFPESRRYPQKELVDGANWSLYDQIQIDSDIEKNFVLNKLNHDDNIVCYFKFPNQFKISLPKIIGNYNPDWGIIRWDENKQFKLELVRETKGHINPNMLQFPNEARKIKCGKKHFELTGVDYKQIVGDEINWWK